MLYFSSGSVYAVELGLSPALMLSISIVSLLLLKQSQFQRLLACFQAAVTGPAALRTPLNPCGGRGSPGLLEQDQDQLCGGFVLEDEQRGPCLAGFLRLPDLCAGS